MKRLKLAQFTRPEQFLGVPYKAGGRDERGLDCYGLAMAVARMWGLELPEFDYEALSGLRPTFPFRRVERGHKGCFVELRATGCAAQAEGVPHCGMFVNGNEIIHATLNHGVRIDRAEYLGVEAIYEIKKA